MLGFCKQKTTGRMKAGDQEEVMSALGRRKGNRVITPRVGRPGFNVVGQLCLLHHPAENGLVASCPYGMR